MRSTANVSSTLKRTVVSNELSAPPALIASDVDVVLQAALQGLGIVYTYDDRIFGWIEEGRLSIPATSNHHRRSQCLAKGRLSNRLTISPAVQKSARAVDADNAVVVGHSIGGTMLASATPFTPYGWFGFGTSTMMVSIIGKSDATGMR